MRARAPIFPLRRSARHGAEIPRPGALAWPFHRLLRARNAPPLSGVKLCDRSSGTREKGPQAALARASSTGWSAPPRTIRSVRHVLKSCV